MEDLKSQEAIKDEVSRLEYEASLAQRQYGKVDPDNRLVASELERRWETTLRSLQSETKLASLVSRHEDQKEIDKKTREQFQKYAQDLPKLWGKNDLIGTEQKKIFLRKLIDKVVLNRIKPDQVKVRIVWKSDKVTETMAVLNVNSLSRVNGMEEIERQIIQFSTENKSDKEIAAILTQQGFHSPHSLVILPQTVQKIRLKNGQLYHEGHSPEKQLAGYLTASQLAKKLNLSKEWLYHRINKKIIEVRRDPVTNLYLFPDNDKVISSINALRKGLVKHVSC